MINPTFWFYLRGPINIFFAVALGFVMTDFRCSRRTVLIVYGILSCLSSVLYLAIFFFFGQHMMMISYAAYTVIPCLIALVYLSKDKLSILFFNLFTTVNVVYLVSIITKLLLFMKDGHYLVECILRILLFTSVIYIFQRHLSKPFHYLAANMKSSWRVIAAIPFFSFCIVMYLGLYPTVRTDNFPAVLMIYVILCLVYYIIHQVFHTTYQQMTEEENVRLMTAQVNFLKSQYEMQERSMEQARILRHDLRHLLTVIRSFLVHEESAQAIALIDEYIENAAAGSISNYCANQVINTLLSQYIEKAQKSGIQMELDIDIPASLPVESADLAMVLANLIENACNSCQQLPNGQRRWIQFICIQSPHFLIQISNPFTGPLTLDDQGLPVAKQENHGIGMKSVLAFLKKYNAIYDLKTEDGIFAFRFMLPDRDGIPAKPKGAAEK